MEQSGSKYFSSPIATSGSAVKEEEAPQYTADNCPVLIRTNVTGDKVFLVKDRIPHWIKSPEALAAVNGDFGNVVTVPYVLIRQLNPQGEVITVDNAQNYKIEKKEEAISTTAFDEKTPEILDTVENAPKEEPEKGFTSIIVPAYFINYPVFHYTGHCLGSIREHTDKVKTPYEIILVINGAGMEGKPKFPNLESTTADKVIQNNENKGYAYAVNQGIRVAKGEYIVVMNNDVMVFTHWLEDFQEALHHKDLVMATPMYGKPYARAVESGILREKTMGSDITQTFSDFHDFSCIATKKSVFGKVGTFDENFFAYKEDIDFLNRMKKEGMSYASTKRINTFHVIGATSMGMNQEELREEEGKKYFDSKYAV